MEFVEMLESEQCRTCYNSTKGLRQLKNVAKGAGSQEQKSYAELLKEVAKINTVEELYCDQLPQLICESCARRLKATHAFILQSQEVNTRLMAIAKKVEASRQLNCLQEPPVDILPINSIKSEKEEDAIDCLGQFEPQCFVDLKVEEPESKITADTATEDVLSIENNGKASTEVFNLKESCEQTNRAKHNSAHKKDTRENMDFSNDEGDDDNQSNSDTEWKDDIDDITQKKTKAKKKNVLKSKKSLYNADDDIAVPCCECNKIFNNSKALARHKRNTHIPEEQKCTCPLCGRRFSRSCNMYKHMRTFHGPDTVPLIRKPSTKERIFQCDKCERNYTKKNHLNVHIKEKHSNQETEKETQPTETSENKTDGEENVKKDKPKKRYEVRSLCSICGSSFASRTHLVVHMRRHTGERPFKCDLCERAYPRLSELVCHRRIHTGEKPFKCKICDKAFRVWSKMSNHMRSHTDIRPYKCKQCERSFKYSKDLNIHFRIHTGERPYKCNVCGSTFTQSNTLKAHRSKLGHLDDDGIIVKNNIA